MTAVLKDRMKVFKNAIEDIRLLTELENLIISLRASGFIGQASDGYNTFFTAKIKPAIKENLYDGKTSLMGTLEQLMTDIKTQLIDTVDPALRDANEGLNQGSNQG